MAKVTALRKWQPTTKGGSTRDEPEKDHGGGDEGDDYFDPEDYWQAAFCAALESPAVTYVVTRATLQAGHEAVIDFCTKIADAALAHALAGAEEVEVPGDN